MKDPQWPTAKNWMSFGDIIYMAQLTTVETRGITVVNCREWNVIGVYCRPLKDSQWSTAEGSMVMVITVIPNLDAVDYCRPMKDPQWSTAVGGMLMAITVMPIWIYN